MNRIVAAVCVALMLMVVVGCNDKALDGYDKVTMGMSLSQVEALMGKGTVQETGGMSISGAGVAGGAVQNSQSTYTWKVKNTEMSVTFAGGKMVSKSKM